ncbi:MAG: hypothetical protein ABI833_15055 [Acidobacteriota bacterium]
MRIAFVILFLALALNGQSSGYLISTVSGSGWIGDGGPATQAILRQPGGVGADASGNIYVAETGGHRVRKVDRTGAITTLAGTGVAGFSGDRGPAAEAQLAFPYGVAADVAGNIYIADLGNGRVRRVGVDGIITTVAGGGTLDPGPANEGMPGTSMRLLAPRNLLADDQGNLYVSDFAAHCVFKLSTAGLLTTVAGTGTPGYSGDGGSAAAAQLDFPAGLAMGFDGALYIADSSNHAVRRISGGVITTFASVGTPVALALDVAATLYVADVERGTLLRFPVNGSLPPLNIPANDIARAPDLSLYLAERAAGIVQRIPLSSGIALAAGGADPARGDGGPSTVALLNHPSGVAADTSGNIYIADRDNHRVRRVTPDGTITSIAPTVAWSAPSGVSVDAAGSVYVVDTGLGQVVRITPQGAVQAIARMLPTAPVAAVADMLGNIYIADADSIRVVDAAGVISTLVDQLAGPHGLALDGVGHFFFTEQDGARVQRLDLISGALSLLAPGAWSIPRGIAVDAAGDVFVADTGHQQILRVDSAGDVTVVAGTAGVPGFSGDGGASASAQLNFPWDVAVGPGGAVYVADLENDRVRQLTLQTTPPAPISVLNGASLAPGPVAPGMLLVVRGSGIPVADAADTIILINSIPVPILAMDDMQIQVQAPSTMATPDDAQIVIVHQGKIAATVTATTAAAAPALFPIDPKAVTAAPGALVTLYGTGLGLGDLPVTATIGGVTAEVAALDPSPGYAGLFRIDLRIPAGPIPEVAAVVVMAGSTTSQAGVNITILPQ